MLHHQIKNLNMYIVRFYGMTQDPETKNYMMILDYAKNGSLRNYLNTSYNKLNWEDKLKGLNNIIFGLENIHNYKFIHRDLHIGNILVFPLSASITDMGLCKPADYNASENTKNSIYGNLPYIAPEILRGQSYTKAVDIYSLGFIMSEISTGQRPFDGLEFNETKLGIKDCNQSLHLELLNVILNC